MKIIKEYRLRKDLITPQTLYITKNAEIVNIVDIDDFDVALIAVCDALEQSTDLRTFQIHASYTNIYENDFKYIGAFKSQHIIEIL